MKLLFVGGTSFVGRHAVEAAVAAGHDVTVFHRGRTNDDLLAGSHRATATAIATPPTTPPSTTTPDWDAVIDVCAYVPRPRPPARRRPSPAGAGHYVHISSISAYDEAAITAGRGLAALRRPGRPDRSRTVTGETYGPLKAMCERAGVQRFGDDRTAVIRPTYVAGPHDPTDRFTYWARRMARGRRRRDRGRRARRCRSSTPATSGAFIVRCAESACAGAFDGVGPWAPVERVPRR